MSVPRKTVFRTDASETIGTGHVMRCLALADALREAGGECHFICRDYPGHVGRRILENGHRLSLLPAPDAGWTPVGKGPPYATWLGARWEDDVRQSAAALDDGKADCVVVDHYGIEERWEAAFRDVTSKIVVIDDLADRRHGCDLLLDQNLGRRDADYADLAPGARLLIGPRYALLRKEFARFRETSLTRRRGKPSTERLLVSLGGSDPDNITSKVLQSLARLPGCGTTKVMVVAGASSRWLERLRALAAEMPFPCSIVSDARNMAEIMTNADVMIGAAGSTSWERCCLGLPGVTIVTAENQRGVAAALLAAGVGEVLTPADIEGCIGEALSRIRNEMATMVHRAAQIADGLGCERVIDAMK